MKIELENEVIECHVQYEKRKKLSLKIDTNGFITMKAPRHTSEEIIRNAIIQQGPWILEKLKNIKKAQELPKAKEYHGEEKFLYLGKEYPLHELIDTSELAEEDLQKALKKYYIASCKKIIAERIKPYQTQLKVKPKVVEIIDSKVKWGSCSSDKKLCFNYRLAMAPVDVIDYVIIHELCHLHHMNHDRSFWRRVGSIMPDYKEKEAYLARYGQFMTL